MPSTIGDITRAADTEMRSPADHAPAPHDG